MLLALCAVSTAAAKSDLPSKSEPSLKTPRDPGVRRMPEPGLKPPSDPGSVEVPPTTDPKAIVKPPPNVDPGMDDATPDIDRKNRKKSQDKKAK